MYTLEVICNLLCGGVYFWWFMVAYRVLTDPNLCPVTIWSTWICMIHH